MAKARMFGTCGCGRTVKPQRNHNDPTIWTCMTCEGSVCDWCYHVHYYEKHEMKASPIPRESQA